MAQRIVVGLISGGTKCNLLKTFADNPPRALVIFLIEGISVIDLH